MASAIAAGPWLIRPTLQSTTHTLRSFVSSTPKPVLPYIRFLSTNPLSEDRDQTSSSSLSKTPSTYTPSTLSQQKTISKLPSGLTPRIESLIKNFQAKQEAFTHHWGKVSDQWHRLANTRYGRLLRWDKPIGTHLLFLPAAWGITLASPSFLPPIELLAQCYLGAFLVRGAGCAINDVWDADIDKKVERTKGRPVTAGQIGVPGAVTAAGLCGLGGLGLLWGMGDAALVVGGLSITGIVLYPLAKRVTRFPQVALGGVFNIGVLVGAGAASGTIGPGALLLYGAGWCWTVIYDTIYACMDREGDMSTKLGSMAVSLGDTERTRKILGLWSVGMLACLAGCGWWEGLGVPFWIGFGAVGGRVFRTIRETNLRDSEACWGAFKGAAKTNVAVWAAIAAGRML